MVETARPYPPEPTRAPHPAPRRRTAPLHAPSDTSRALRNRCAPSAFRAAADAAATREPVDCCRAHHFAGLRRRLPRTTR
ncbi:hypothetical protein [Streptomyces xiaopingdaonensis]|uniref:hypothetical protein n=1 Tax=Streptomyces xiaopingdaonensis TaxID=1565415 RepID=UPI00037F3B03|nr:hypothetical protein [Streptomyces xiaopingdaonensis]